MVGEAMTDAEMLQVVERMYLKTSEILAMMKKGEFIVAHEKLGGIQKILSSLGGELQRKLREHEKTE
jgi:hypothetical protein